MNLVLLYRERDEPGTYCDAVRTTCAGCFTDIPPSIVFLHVERVVRRPSFSFQAFVVRRGAG